MRTINSFILILLLSVVLFAQSAKGQIAITVTGNTNTTPNLSTSYGSLALAISAMNGRTAMSGPVIFNLAANGTETAPAAGYLLGNATLNSLTSASKTITFQKSSSGVNPLITAFTPGTSTTVDGIWKIQGTDYVTISNIDLQENASNTTPTQQMEWGYAIVKLSLSDGSQNININGCTVTLNKSNTVSKGIYGGNHIATSTTALVVASAAGTNANIKINGCTVSNCYIPINIAGWTTSPYYDTGLEIGTTTANTVSNYGGGASTTYGIYITGQTDPKIENNSVTLGTGTTTTAYGINVAAACIGYLKINANTVSVSSSATASQLTAINNLAPITTTLDITSNIVQNCNYATATSGSFYIIYEQAATTGCTVNITGNTVSGCVYSGAALAGSGGVIAIFKSGGTPTVVNVNSNTVNGNTMTGTTGGTFYGINVGSGTTQNINSNNIFNNTISGTGTAGTIYGIKSTGISGTVVHNLNNIYNNQITKTTGTTGFIYGIYNGSTPTSETYTNNTIYGLSSAGVNTVYGINASPTSAGTRTVSGNTINSLSSAGGTVYGIYQLISSPNIFQNKIYDLSSTTSAGLVYGIYIKTGTTVSIYNNLISDLRTPDANTLATVVPLAGIYLEGGTTNNIYYNTVFLNASSTGALFGSAGLYSVTTTTLDLRNNIFANTSTPTGAGFTAAYRRSNTTLTTYASTSNYNLFYAGTPGANRLIMYDGTNSYQTLAAYKTAVGPTRDAASVTGDPGLTSISDLTPNPSDPNCWNIRGGAYPIANVTTDFAGTQRHTAVTDGPEDIGAYKFTPAVEPNPLVVTGSYGNGNTSILTFAGTTIATITWHSGSGTLPTSISAVFKPGTLPPGTLTGTYAYEYLDITATGSTLPYTYDLTLYYNLARTYNITVTDQTNLRVAKYSSGTWSALLANTTTTPSSRTVAVTAIADGFSSFSFTGNDTPLPVELSSFTSNVNGRDVQLKWTTSIEINNSGFEIERAGVSSQELEYSKIAFVNGVGNSNTAVNYSFTDRNLNVGKYNYRLKQIDVNGNFEYHNLNTVIVVGLPAKFDLGQNYPNPFNPTTKINFNLPVDSRITLVIYNMLGSEVKTLINNEQRAAGFYTIDFNGSSMSSGTYFYRFIAESNGKQTVMTKKLTLIK